MSLTEHQFVLCNGCRNGPGTYKLGNQELAHPFDGHGFIISIAIKNGKAYARARFVETPE